MKSIYEMLRSVRIMGFQFLADDVKAVKANRLGKTAEVHFFTDNEMADDLMKDGVKYTGIIVLLDAEQFRSFVNEETTIRITT